MLFSSWGLCISVMLLYPIQTTWRRSGTLFPVLVLWQYEDEVAHNCAALVSTVLCGQFIAAYIWIWGMQSYWFRESRLQEGRFGLGDNRMGRVLSSQCTRAFVQDQARWHTPFLLYWSPWYVFTNLFALLWTKRSICHVLEWMWSHQKEAPHQEWDNWNPLWAKTRKKTIEIPCALDLSSSPTLSWMSTTLLCTMAYTCTHFAILRLKGWYTQGEIGWQEWLGWLHMLGFSRCALRRRERLSSFLQHQGQ